MPRRNKTDSANDRTVTLTDEALKKYNTWGHRKSELTSKAIIAYEPNSSWECNYITREEAQKMIDKAIQELEEMLKHPF